ncbi:MraY family glycosyltransferase [Spirosoma agri]|uniref:Glycosyltransferase family 4 protein n=1 Tax=Spirosoma agri TaxID=1987381 RepID=A0A6M0IRM3_9BACT|nr:hypothetical protein [Spirosoma agri]NEU69603.1 hypothetical protein [Spirosoma agri]
MTPTGSVFLAAVLVCCELLYLRVARHFGIVDTPNERSAHTGLAIIRGGGVLFWMAALVAFVHSGFVYAYFFAGLTLVAVVSFLDDLRSLAYQYRIGAHLVAVGLLLYQLDYPMPAFWVIGLLLLAGAGILNAYNFMDGINGITAFYSLVTVGTLWYTTLQPASSQVIDSLLPNTFVALLVFSYFNARNQAICFAGDVGSMSLAFIVLYALAQFMITKQTWLPILFLAVYGVDSGLTIGQRLYRRQNIFRAHNLHLFQLLVHKRHWPHLRVATLYSLIQVAINLLVLQALTWSFVGQTMTAVVVVGLLISVYVVVKVRLMNA